MTRPHFLHDFQYLASRIVPYFIHLPAVLSDVLNMWFFWGENGSTDRLSRDNAESRVTKDPE